MDLTHNMKSEWFTSEFLQNVLRKSESDDSIMVVSNSADQMGQKGDNYGSTMSRITLLITRNGETQKKSLIVKVLPEGEEMRAVFFSTGAFPREIKMFTEILPRMHALLDTVEPGKYNKFGARCYYSEDEVPYVVMLEDLSVQGFMLAERSRGLDLDHCLLVMKAIARFHACSRVLHEENQSLFDIFSKSSLFEGDAMKNLMTTFIRQQFPLVTNAMEKWENGGKELAEKLRLRSETASDDFIKAQRFDPSDFNVLNHNDFSINNIMFKYDQNSGKVSDVILVDFQLCTVVSFAIDLQFLIFGSVSDDVRQHHLDDLLKCYHSEMTRTLTVLGHGHRAPSYERLLAEFESKSVIGFLWTVVALPVFMTPRGVAHDFENMLKDGESSPSQRGLSEECEKAQKRQLPLFHQRGFF